MATMNSAVLRGQGLSQALCLRGLFVSLCGDAPVLWMWKSVDSLEAWSLDFSGQGALLL